MKKLSTILVIALVIIGIVTFYLLKNNNHTQTQREKTDHVFREFRLQCLHGFLHGLRHDLLHRLTAQRGGNPEHGRPVLAKEQLHGR